VDWGELGLGICACCAAGAAGWCLEGSAWVRRAVADAKVSANACIRVPDWRGSLLQSLAKARVLRAARVTTPIARRELPLVSVVPRQGWQRTANKARTLVFGWCSDGNGRSRHWALVMASSAALVGGASIAANAAARTSPSSSDLTLLWLVAWATMATFLGLVDLEEMVVPSSLVRVAVVLSAALCAATCAANHQWGPLERAATCGVGAWVVFAGWAFVAPSKLGFGDARMAALVALGAGAAGAGRTFVALSCAPLAAAIAGRCLATKGEHRRQGLRRARKSRTTEGKQPSVNVAGNQGPSKHVAVPLGPFLALAGITVVVAHAA